MDGLPEIFSTREAFKLLDWQGSRQGLARYLQASGFEPVTASQPNGHGTRRMWRRPGGLVAGTAACACRCHTGTCGANDMILAERTIRLVEKLRPYSEEAIMQVVDLVQLAGVEFARSALPVTFDDDAPF